MWKSPSFLSIGPQGTSFDTFAVAHSVCNSYHSGDSAMSTRTLSSKTMTDALPPSASSAPTHSVSASASHRRRSFGSSVGGRFQNHFASAARSTAT